MPTNTPNPGERRVILRRSRGQGARFSNAGRVDGTPRDPVTDDEVEDEIDLDNHVRNLSRRSEAPAPADDPEGNNPAQRMMDVASAGDAAYAREYRLALLHKMLLRKMPLDQIAQALRVSISTVQKDRIKLKAMLREAAKELNIDEMIGNQNAMYDEVQAMSLRIASKTSGAGAVPVAMQLAGMRTALAANADRTRFFQTAGVFDVLRYRKADTGEAQSDIELLMQETRQMLAALQDPDGMGGFDDYTFQDAGEPESEEL